MPYAVVHKIIPSIFRIMVHQRRVTGMWPWSAPYGYGWSWSEPSASLKSGRSAVGPCPWPPFILL